MIPMRAALLPLVGFLGSAEDFLSYIGCKFFNNEGDGIDSHVETPLLGGVSETAFAGGVVKGGDAGGAAGAEDFAGIEDGTAVVRAGDEGARESVAGALGEGAAGEGVEAGIFVGKGGNDGFDEEVFLGLVGGGVPEIAGIAEATAAELGVGVGAEGVAGEGGGDEDGGVVERVLEGGGEFGLDGHRWKFFVGADGAEVGDDPEDAFAAGGTGGPGLCGLGVGGVGQRGLCRVGGAQRA